MRLNFFAAPAVAGALFAGLLCAPAAVGSEGSDGLFAEARSALAPRPILGREAATLRSRIVQVDLKQLASARKGGKALELNLFDDAVFEARIERVRPTRSGYFLSGTVQGVDRSEARLLVNGPLIVGEINTPQGYYTILPDRLGRHIIRQIDSSELLCGTEEEIHPAGVSSRRREAAEVPSIRGGTHIDLMVIYTPRAKTRRGGSAQIETVIDLWVAATNEALNLSGLPVFFDLVHSAEVQYTETSNDSSDILDDLRRDLDGQLDEVFELRNKYAADMVALLFDAESSGLLIGGGTAQILGSLSAISINSASATFVHELGHNMGLHHDRYTLIQDGFSTPGDEDNFGYVNQKAFLPSALETSRWRTVMSYTDQCRDAGLSCSRLQRFSNASLRYNGDLTGISTQQSSSSGPDGPANAVLTLQSNFAVVRDFRTSDCTSFDLSSQSFLLPDEGGSFSVSVSAEEKCVWEAQRDAGSGFLSVNSNRYNNGGDIVFFTVGRNRGGGDRTGTLTVAGHTITVRQTSDLSPGICSRTPEVVEAITSALGLNQADCGDVTDAQLSTITTSFDLAQRRVSTLQQGDFAGLSGLSELDLSGNQLTGLPSGVFAGLTALTKLSLNDNQLAALPSGVFADLTALTELTLDDNQLAALPSGVFADLTALTKLSLGDNQLGALPSGVFANLSKLENLTLQNNSLASLPSGVFANLSKLENLTLQNNSLASLPSGVFADLTALKDVRLFNNQLMTLPSAVFAGVSSKLATVHLGGNPGSPFPLTVSLAPAGRDRVKAIIPSGAPFEMVLPVSVTNGRVDGGADTITIPAGKVESDTFLSLIKTTASPDVTVDIGTLPMPPTRANVFDFFAPHHEGYELVKSSDLPLTINVTEGNNPPVAEDLTIGLNEDASYPFEAADFGFADTDAGDALASVKIVTLPDAGALKLADAAVTAGREIEADDLDALVFSPAANEFGSPYASFTFTVSDGEAESDPPNTITFNVTSVNDAPSAEDLTIGLNEDASFPFGVPDFAFTDADAGDALASVKIVTPPDAGALKLAGAAVTAGREIEADDLGHLVFTPAANEFGSPYASFTFTVSDGEAESDPPNTITINVTAVNDAPSSADKAITLNEDASHTFTASDFAFTDADTDDTLASVKIVTLPDKGKLELVSRSSVGSGVVYSYIAITADKVIAVKNLDMLRFTPASGASGSPYASFTFTVSDGTLASDPANTITLNVTGVNDAPTSSDKAITLNEDASYTFAASDFAFTDVDAGDALDGVRIVTLPEAGTLELDGAAVTARQLIGAGELGSLTFSPADDGFGSPYSSFTFTVSDGTLASDPANTITINVTGVNDAPVSSDRVIGVQEDTSYTFGASDFAFTDADEDDALASVKVVSLPGAGTLELDGTVVVADQVIAAAALSDLAFTPASGASGSPYASFTFTVSDGTLASDPANTITINVTGVNDAPSSSDQTVTLNEDTPYTFAASDFAFTDVDAGDALDGVRIVTLPGAGTLELDGNVVTPGQLVPLADLPDLVFAPADDGFGSPYASFTFRVSDGEAESASANTITLNVTGVNDAPVSSDRVIGVQEDTSYTFGASDFAFTDADEDDALASVKVVSLPGAGTLELDGTAVTADQVIAAAALSDLAFTPASGAY